jgi:predicted transcriptional regulator
MPPKKSNTLTEAELRLMKILWRRGESAVTDLVGDLPEGEELAYNSVLTTIRILEQKGYVEHRQEGRAFVYRPCVAEHEASRSEVRHVLNRFFGNSRERLLLSLLGDEEISAEELERLKEAIRSAAPDVPEHAAPGIAGGTARMDDILPGDILPGDILPNDFLPGEEFEA